MTSDSKMHISKMGVPQDSSFGALLFCIGGSYEAVHNFSMQMMLSYMFLQKLNTAHIVMLFLFSKNISLFSVLIYISLISLNFIIIVSVTMC